MSPVTAYSWTFRGLMPGTARETINTDGCGSKKAQNLCLNVGQALRIIHSPELS